MFVGLNFNIRAGGFPWGFSFLLEGMGFFLAPLAGGTLFLPSFLWILPHPHAWGSRNSSPGPLFLLKGGNAASWNVDALAEWPAPLKPLSLLLGGGVGGWGGVRFASPSLVTPGLD